MTLQLKYREPDTLPVDVEGMLPEQLADLSLAEIERLDVLHGNRTVALGELFDITGNPTDLAIEFQGDLTHVHRIGAGLKQGRIEVHGNAGRHLGSAMRGGEIHVSGDAGDWLGAEMRGGLLRVDGNVADSVGAAYRGSPRGMRGGTILVRGNAGDEIGSKMRRGLIVVGGDCGDMVGFGMLAGNVYVFGNCGRRHGAAMRRGTLGFFGAERPPLLPTFRSAGTVRPPFLNILAKQLAAHDFAVPTTLSQGTFELFHGDLLESGRGEILLPNG